MKNAVPDIMDEAMDGDVWNDILSPETETVMSDLNRLATEYSCHGCSY